MPYMTGSPIMAPLPMRPANAQDPTDTSKILPMDIDDSSSADEVFARNQMRQQQEERSKRLAAKNRRKRYLEVHPEYFDDSSLELADPLLYDRLIRRFQTARERETEGQRKGFSGQMSTDLWRAEAKKDALQHTDPKSLFIYTRGPQGQIVEEDKDEVPMTKEEGKAWWMDEMTQRFLSGADDDFDYKTVDENEKYDDEKERDIQDAYFDSMESDFDSDGEGKEKVLTGETGIQDY
ncbi:coiled-coil domain-containing protein [Stagonosporopsis vannaccii]|nr:coiled-coil domain-containing protein [Stagonosporopsis vannaccii]